MARPARARTAGGAAERRRVVSATSEACSVARRESWVWAKAAGEREREVGGMVGLRALGALLGWMGWRSRDRC